jgi:hypothetical protein
MDKRIDMKRAAIDRLDSKEVTLEAHIATCVASLERLRGEREMKLATITEMEELRDEAAVAQTRLEEVYALQTEYEKNNQWYPGMDENIKLDRNPQYLAWEAEAKELRDLISGNDKKVSQIYYSRER